VILEHPGDRRRALLAFERHGQQARRLVEHDQTIVLVHDLQIVRAADEGRRRLRAPGPIHPHADEVAFGQPHRGVRQGIGNA